MNALSKLFETLHLSRRESASRRSHRRRHTRRQGSALSCETLEPKQLLAADLVAPIALDPVQVTDAPVAISLEGKFEDDEVFGTVVKFETNAPLSDPDFYVELTDNTPLTNANFLSYVNSGAYDNSEFHRSISGFVIQGGGFKHPTVPADQPGSDPDPIPTTGTVQNEPGNLNTRGTIAMAKLGGQPDSATSQFFFNLSDNPSLNSDNGGYTQFGSVLGSGMTVVDTIGSALTYDATTYYSNAALSDLPLWNVNEDNIVRPEDFVQIDNADEVSESDLFNYTFSGFDTNKLTVSESNGNIVLTPVGNATGTFNVTVTATSKLDNSIASDTFSVQLNGGGPVDPVLTAIESNGSVILNVDAAGKIYAGDTPILDRDGVTQLGAVGGWEYLAAEADSTFNNTNTVLLKRTSDSLVYLYRFNSDWTRSSSLPTRIIANGANGYDDVENLFNVDANNDGNIRPSLTPIESNGSVILNVDAAGKIYAGDTPILDRDGVTQLGAVGGWEYLAAEADSTFNNTNTVLLKRTSDSLVYLYRFNSDWTRSSSLPTRIIANGANGYDDVENLFNVDANNDGNIRPSLTPIESNGSVILNVDAAGKIYAGDTPILDRDGVTQLGAVGGWEYLAAEADSTFNNTNTVLLKRTSDSLVYLYRFNSDWTRSSSLPTRIIANGANGYDDVENLFNVDANNDGNIRPSLTPIESNGSVILNVDAAGKIYAGDTPILDRDGVTQLGAVGGWEYLAAEADSTFNNTNTVLLKRTSDSLVYLYRFNSDWTRSSSLPTRIIANGANGYDDVENLFNVDANNDGNIRPSLTPIESNGSVILNVNAAGKIYAGDTPILDRDGVTQLGAVGGWEYLAAEADSTFNNTNTVLLKRTSDSLVYLYRFNSDWTRSSSLPTRIIANGANGYDDVENLFNVDANNDGNIRPSLTPIESNGSVILNVDAAGKIYAGDTPILDRDGVTQLGAVSGWEYLAAEADSTFNNTNTVLLKRTSDSLVYLYRFNSDWTRSSSLPTRIIANGANGYDDVENLFNVDANNDGNIRPSLTPIESNGSVILNVNAAGKIYAGDTPILDRDGVTQLGAVSGWEYLAAEADSTFNNTNTVLLKRTSDSLVYLYRFNSDWTRSSSLPTRIIANGANGYDEILSQFLT